VSLAALIAAQRAQHGIPHAVSCRALGVSPAWFYKWRGGDRSLRRKRRDALAALAAFVFAKHEGTYGSPRITADLHERAGRKVSVNTVARLMAEQGLVARAKRRRRSTTRQDKAGPQGPRCAQSGLLAAAAAQPALVWGSDRDPHRRRQALSRRGAGPALAPLRGLRPR
jgi:putative transposase